MSNNFGHRVLVRMLAFLVACGCGYVRPHQITKITPEPIDIPSSPSSETPTCISVPTLFPTITPCYSNRMSTEMTSTNTAEVAIPKPTNSPTLKPIPIEVQGYTIDQKAIEPMERAIAIIYRNLREFEISEGIEYNSNDLYETAQKGAYALADTWSESLNSPKDVLERVTDNHIIEQEARALLRYLKSKYDNL